MDPDTKIWSDVEIEASLSALDMETVRLWITKDHGYLDRGSLRPTPEQVNHGMTTPYKMKDGTVKWQLAVMWVNRKDYPPTVEQIEHGLSHSSYRIRAAWAARHDFQPTASQITVGFEDNDSYVVESWMKRPGLNLTEHHLGILIDTYISQYGALFADKPALEAIQCLQINHVQLSEDSIDKIRKMTIYLFEVSCMEFIRQQYAGLAAMHVASQVTRKNRTNRRNAL